MLNRNLAGALLFGFCFILSVIYGFTRSWEPYIIAGMPLFALISIGFAKRIK